MKRMWHIFGRIVYWGGWPVSFITLYFSKRTRILVTHNDEVLLVKGWLSDGRWHAPGGGLHKGEDPAIGAMRELKEEVGITASKSQLKPLFQKRVKTKWNLSYYCYAYVLELNKKPQLSLQKGEITEADWLSFEVIENNIGSAVISEMLATWAASR